MKIGLRLIQRGYEDPPTPVSHTYRVKLDDELVNYHLAFRKEIKNNSSNWTDKTTEIGYISPEQTLHVNRMLSETVVPFAALLLHYQAMPREDLENKLSARYGQEIDLSSTDDEQRNLIAAGHVLGVASNYLTDKELEGFVQALKTESYYDSSIIEPIAAKLTERAKSPQALVLARDDQVKHYFDSVGNYLDAHSRNRSVQRSESYQSMAQNFSLRRLFSSDVSQPDKFTAQINGKWRDKLPEFYVFLTQITQSAKGDVVEVPEQLRQIVYEVQEELESSGSRKLPFKYQSADSTNIVIGTRRFDRVTQSPTKQDFIVGLKTRVAKRLFNEHKKLQALGSYISRNEVVAGSDIANLLTSAIMQKGGNVLNHESIQTALVPLGSNLVNNDKRNLEDVISQRPANAVEVDKVAQAEIMLASLELGDSDAARELASRRRQAASESISSVVDSAQDVPRSLPLIDRT